MDLFWKKEYQLGVDEIDAQHKYFLGLIEKFNFVANKEDSTKDHEYIIRLIRELVLYAEFHFCSEENIMFLYNYPGLNDHANLHSDLIEDLNSYTYNEEISHEKLERLVIFLTEWFLKHTVEEDMHLAQYIHKK